MDQWKKIRLELARTRDFPAGSVSRGFLISLPLDRDGHIDDEALSIKPHRATVRRYWSNEAEESGNVIPLAGGWALRCNGGPDRMLLLGGHSIRLGEQVSVLDGDGAVLPFTVASIH